MEGMGNSGDVWPTMNEERIGLARLRHRIEKRGAPEQAPLSAGEVLALLEAVVAAHDLERQLARRATLGLPLTARRETLERLGDRLARFDFEDAAVPR